MLEASKTLSCGMTSFRNAQMDLLCMKGEKGGTDGVRDTQHRLTRGPAEPRLGSGDSRDGKHWER